MVTIAGMGSFLIVEILEKNIAYLNKVKQFYLQPNANTDHLRKFLFKNHCNDAVESGEPRLSGGRQRAGLCYGATRNSRPPQDGAAACRRKTPFLCV